MLQYNQKDMYDKMTTTIFGTQATPQKPNKTTSRISSSSSNNNSNVPRVSTFFSGSTHDNNDDDGALPKVRTKHQAVQWELWYYYWGTVDTLWTLLTHFLTTFLTNTLLLTGMDQHVVVASD